MRPRLFSGLAAWGIAGVSPVFAAGAAAPFPGALSLGSPPDAVRPLMLQSSIVNPADVGRESLPASRPAGADRVRTWELPPIEVTGAPAAELREEDRVGGYAQPRWTTDRRFSETRVYVIPEGKVEAEYWFRPTVARKGPSEILQQFEVEFGLPGRFQLDLYLIPVKEGADGRTFLNNSVELRYALADWGKLWGNPTLYGEYTFRDSASDLIEVKLLLADELAPRWHWGVNLSFEHAFGDDFYNEYEITSGVSYTLVDSVFSLGVEEKAAFQDVHGSRGSFGHEVFLGPSLQYRPLPPVHIDFAPLIGIGHESPAMQLFLVLGYEF